MNRRPDVTTLPRDLHLENILIAIPCSGAKRNGSAPSTGTSVIQALPRELSIELAQQRRRNADIAGVDETTLLPAVERYGGTLYDTGRSAIANLAGQGASVLIISGGYGLVMADESIGMYEQVFRPALWTNRIIERCLAGFAERNDIRQVIGVLSATTGYSTVFRRTQWPQHVNQVVLASPESTTGAMVKAPRAEGEWLAAMAESGGLPRSWLSSDGLRMETTLL